VRIINGGERRTTLIVRQESWRTPSVDVVAASWERIRRAAVPSWPGQTFDASRAFSAEELARDKPLKGAAEALAGLSRDWEVSFLTARGFPDAFALTEQWLHDHGFSHFSRLVVVGQARDKVAWLEEEMAATEAAVLPESRRVLLVDDLSRGHHLAKPEPDRETIGLLQEAGIPFEVFDFADDEAWPKLAQRLSSQSNHMAEVVLPSKRSRCKGSIESPMRL